MRKHSICIVIWAALAIYLPALALAADSFLGTWHFNLEKSRIDLIPPPPVNTYRFTHFSATTTFQAQGDYIKMIVDVTDPTDPIAHSEGKSHHAEGIVRFDGNEYPANGGFPGTTIALIKINDHTLESVLRNTGHEIARERLVISRDGDTMTSTSKYNNGMGQDVVRIMVFDKE